MTWHVIAHDDVFPPTPPGEVIAAGLRANDVHNLSHSSEHLKYCEWKVSGRGYGTVELGCIFLLSAEWRGVIAAGFNAVADVALERAQMAILNLFCGVDGV
jgi:hypothetical protein